MATRQTIETAAQRRWLGTAVPRKEDPALLTGEGRFIDDLEPFPNLYHAAILRSPHAHARITAIDASRALAIDGVAGVLTGEHVKASCKPFAVGIETQPSFYPCAIDRVRYAGEPVAVVVARDRYLAEDALEAISVSYEPLPAVVSIDDALAP
ncbi:MAG: hypothetical protein ACREMT_09025 [Vulcanimicrobiaceae bacterium]